MKIFLCGYQSIGCRVLSHLLSCRDVSALAVFSHDAPSHVESIARVCQATGVWHTTRSVNELEYWPFRPDVIASVYYRSIILPPVIEAVRGRIFNVHPSLLPRHRGCSSLAWAIFQGDPITGVTFHYIDAGVDTGRVILQAAIQVSAEETQASLYERAMRVGGDYWPAALELVKTGFTGIPQTGTTTRHRRGAPHGGEVDDRWPLDKVERFLRAMTAPPLPYATYRGVEVKTMEEFLELRRRATQAEHSAKLCA